MPTIPLVVKDDIYDFFENVICSFHGTTIFHEEYEAGLLSFLTQDELPAIVSLKRSYINDNKRIDDEYLSELTKPLILSLKYYGSQDYMRYISELAYEIKEYKALENVREYLRSTLEDRLTNDPVIQQKVKGSHPDFGRYRHRLKDKLLHQFIVKTDTLAERYLKDLTREYFSEQTAFILAKVGILVGLDCAHKTTGFKCYSTDCIKIRFTSIDLDVCYETNSREHCSVCHVKKKCPSYHPCPPGIQRYKIALQRAKSPKTSPEV